MTICTYNARTPASEATIEDLIMQAKKIKYDVIGLTETRRRHLLNAVYETGEELFLGTCDSRGFGEVGVLVNTRTAKNIDSFEQLTTRIGRLRMRSCGPTLNTGDFNAKVGPRRTPGELHIGTHDLQWNDQGESSLSSS
ncbi:hypothetical protein RB195_024450 [Necator americanus]|uniref:Endonuclease/exonuclease/phosphatase domain-containing protein n=1 Tax=Necator americanus TaxID=51031 RepID=A0ABR1EN73_NECAM